MKKPVRTVICILLAAMLFGGLAYIGHVTQIIGNMKGIENEYIVLKDGRTYEICDGNHTHRHTGRMIGKVWQNASQGVAYAVFSVEDQYPEEHIYVASMGQGAFYRRTN